MHEEGKSNHQGRNGDKQISKISDVEKGMTMPSQTPISSRDSRLDHFRPIHDRSFHRTKSSRIPCMHFRQFYQKAL